MFVWNVGVGSVRVPSLCSTSTPHFWMAPERATLSVGSVEKVSLEVCISQISASIYITSFPVTSFPCTVLPQVFGGSWLLECFSLKPAIHIQTSMLGKGISYEEHRKAFKYGPVHQPRMTVMTDERHSPGNTFKFDSNDWMNWSSVGPPRIFSSWMGTVILAQIDSTYGPCTVRILYTNELWWRKCFCATAKPYNSSVA